MGSLRPKAAAERSRDASGKPAPGGSVRGDPGGNVLGSWPELPNPSAGSNTFYVSHVICACILGALLAWKRSGVAFRNPTTP